ncbi:PIG-L family deacetylase [Geomonas sp. Red32]|uniref:PIG-L deacetylase family protein n=1 Tax=Geomonas sp. Red32 TaxID=2912856 RepID=UPI00202CED1E|nr:PIG-L deacetylase family protein [Geomonas sp. Red32]MCM0083334.1 PIG-L family deacetylase [Geomonas sp. Red32]
MLSLRLNLIEDRPLRLLFLGAHSDDIEIGCGGTVLKLLAGNRHAEVRWVVLGSSGERDAEALASAEDFLRGAGKRTVVVEHFRDGFFPYHGGEIKDYFERMKGRFAPDLIFTHYRNDLHQDHRLVSELTWNTFRDHLVLEYEILKYDGDLGNPNLFVALDRETAAEKVSLLTRHFRSQSRHQWFTEDSFQGLMRIRGVQSAAGGGYAEAFYCRKCALDSGGRP